jgi:hypothetical protein
MTKSRSLLILVALLAFSVTGPLWAAAPPAAAPAVSAPDQAALASAIFAPAEKAQEPKEAALPDGLRIEDLTPTPVPMTCTNSYCQSMGCYVCRNGLCLC